MFFFFICLAERAFALPLTNRITSINMHSAPAVTCLDAQTLIESKKKKEKKKHLLIFIAILCVFSLLLSMPVCFIKRHSGAKQTNKTF